MPAIQTYIPLYRKYRPQSFDDLVGQQAIVQTLTNAIATNKVAHAYLLCGPRGTGKTSTARILAKSLNCVQGPTATPCQTCDACVGVTHGAAIDIIEIDAASNNGVDDARELIENCQFAPMAGRYKIYIVDEVHMLTTQAFNALLKTLEEPPPNVVFIFATTEAHKVLPTIISRCQRFDFSRITAAQMADQLARIAQSEGIRIAPEALHAIARHARGGMRNALSMLDQVGVLSQAQADTIISAADVTRFIGALEQEALFSLTEAIARHDAPTLLAALAALNDRGVEPTLLVRDLTQHVRDLFLVAVSEPTAEALPLNASAEALPQLRQQASAFAREEYPQLLDALAALERELRRTQQPQLWLEIGLLDLAFRVNIQTLQGLADRVAALEQALAAGVPALNAHASALPAAPTAPQPTRNAAVSPSASTPPPAPAVSAPVARPPVSPPPQAPPMTAAHGLDWDAMIASIPSMPLRAQLTQQAFLLSVEGNRVTIGCPSEPILQALKKEDKFFHLQKAVEAIMGRAMQVVIVLEKNRPGRSAPAPTASPPLPPVAQTPALSAPPPAEAITPPIPAPPPEVMAPETLEPEVPALPPLAEAPALPPPLPPVSAPAVGTPTAEEDSDLAEAKKYTLELLQGKPLG